METWSNHNPTTFLHFRLLMEAETARLWGDPSRAAELYDEAIDTANQNGFLRYEAFCQRIMVKFHLEQAREKLSGYMREQAQYLYSRWGATAKVQHLEETLRPILLRSDAPREKGWRRAGRSDGEQPGIGPGYDASRRRKRWLVRSTSTSC